MNDNSIQSHELDNESNVAQNSGAPIEPHSGTRSTGVIRDIVFFFSGKKKKETNDPISNKNQVK